MEIEYAPKVKCSKCGETKEGYILKIKVWFFPVRRGLCQTCISKMFSGLKRGK